MKITFTEDQKNTLKAVHHFLKNKEKKLIITGYAGTGKTTLTQYISKLAKEAGRKTFLCAPTNKAVEVFREKASKYGICSTLHKLIYNVDKRGRMHLRKSCSHPHSLIICDESSMLDDKLVDDLMSYARRFSHKVVFMGDTFQLPPIQRTRYPILEDAGASNMSQVCRQGADSSILLYATALRGMKKTSPVMPDSSSGDVILDTKDNVWKSYIESLKKGEDSTYIVWRNDTRSRANLVARANLGYKGSVKSGEILMVIANDNTFNNGEIIKLDKFTVLGTVDLFYRPRSFKSFGKRDGENNTLNTCKTELIITEKNKTPILFVPNYKEPSLYHSQVDVISLDKAIRSIMSDNDWSSYLSDKDNPRDMFVKSDKRRLSLSKDVIIATYGYAITAHKAQGSQWENVFIGEVCKLRDNVESARWIYTAATRASSKLYISKGTISNTLTWDKMKDIANNYMQ